MALCREAWPRELAAVEGQVAQAHQAGLGGQAQHLGEQVGEDFQMALAEVADGAEVGAVVADDGQEGQVALASGGDLATGIDTDAVGIKQQADQQARVERGLPARLHLVGGVEGIEVELGYGVQEEEDEVTLGKAVSGGEVLSGVVLGVPGAILLAAGGGHGKSSRYTEGTEAVRGGEHPRLTSAAAS